MAGNAARMVSTPVPFVTIDREHAPMLPLLREAFERVVGTSGFILGHEVEMFESEFAAYCGTAHCVGVASGTAALALTLTAAGIGPGDEVIVPGHTFIASALAVLHAGATPVFADVEESTGLLDPAAAEAVLTERTAAIMAVHLYGQICEMEAIGALASRHGLFVLEDAAQAHGARLGERRAGSLGDAAAFSFYPSKNLGALGDGGAICTDDADIARRARELRHLGQRSKGYHVVVGVNARLDGLQAAFLRVKLPHLDAANDARRALALVYDQHIESFAAVLRERPGTQCIYHLYPIRLEDRDAVAARLEAAGIGVGVHYNPAAHRHAAFAELTEASLPLPLPVAERWAAEQLSLPMGPALTTREVEHAAEMLRMVALLAH